MQVLLTLFIPILVLSHFFGNKWWWGIFRRSQAEIEPGPLKQGATGHYRAFSLLEPGSGRDGRAHVHPHLREQGA